MTQTDAKHGTLAPAMKSRVRAIRPDTQVLVVEDDAAMGALLVRELGRVGYVVRHAASARAALDVVETHRFDAVISDVRLGGMTGLELCTRLVEVIPDVPVILVTAFGDLDTAIAALRAGAHDFLPKPFEVEDLANRIAHATELRQLREEVRRLRETHGTDHAGMIGESPSMQRLYGLLDRVASSGAPVLIRGETGTGKELVARAVHARSTRASGPFVAINCAAVPAELLESELFGHVRGAFTGAQKQRNGLFLEASGGTLFLDEVAELPVALQAKLLRALQEKCVRPVGSDKEIPFDARIVSATHRDVDALVEQGAFREDLSYRLNVLNLALPPLRERGSDILLLADHFRAAIAERTGREVRGIRADAARRLLDYAWPGNVRELASAMERAVALAEYETITVADLPEKIQKWKPSQLFPETSDPADLIPLDEIERRYILRVLEAAGGNRSRAAEILGVDRKTLYSKLKSYGARTSDPG